MSEDCDFQHFTCGSVCAGGSPPRWPRLTNPRVCPAGATHQAAAKVGGGLRHTAGGPCPRRDSRGHHAGSASAVRWLRRAPQPPSTRCARRVCLAHGPVSAPTAPASHSDVSLYFIGGAVRRPRPSALSSRQSLSLGRSGQAAGRRPRLGSRSGAIWRVSVRLGARCQNPPPPGPRAQGGSHCGSALRSHGRRAYILSICRVCMYTFTDTGLRKCIALVHTGAFASLTRTATRRVLRRRSRS